MSQEGDHPETPYESADGKPQRQGKLFFRLCDMRVATLGVNILNVVVITIGMLVHLIKYFGIMPIQAAIPAFILSGIAIFGALTFELWAVTMATVGFVVSLMVDFWWLNIMGLIMGCLILYPTATLAHELHKNILTKETYSEREEFIDYESMEKVGIKKTYLTNLHDQIDGYLPSSLQAQTATK